MFRKGVYLYVFHYLCYVKNMSTYFLEEQLSGKRDTELNEEEDINMDGISDNNWRGVASEGDNNNKIHALRWDVCVKEKERLIKGDIFWCPFRI